MTWLERIFIVVFLVFLALTRQANAALTDIKFGQYQIADSQWNVSACLNTTTCQIYSKNPGTMYKIPWTSGRWTWQPGQYVKFVLSGNASYPYTAYVYNSNGTVAGTVGTGKIVNMGPDYFFFVGSDNNTGQLFSGSLGMNSTAGVTWTGTQNPTTAQADAYADVNYSTEPLSAGQTATTTPGGGSSPPPAPVYSSDITAPQQGRVDQWLNRGNTRSGIYVEQIGTSNTVNITQGGNRNNYIRHQENGNLNSTTIVQSADANTANGQYIENTTAGSNNTIELRQSGSPNKQMFSSVGSSNSVTVNQKDGGNHYLDLSMTGVGHAATVIQEGSAQHRSTISSTNAGGASNISVNQSGTTGRVFSVEQTCVSAGGCGVSIIQN